MTPSGPPGTPDRGRRPASPRPAPRRGGVARAGARPDPRPQARAPRAAAPSRSTRPAPRQRQAPRPRRQPVPQARAVRTSTVQWRAGRPRVRLVGLLGVVLLCFVAIMVRLVQVQVVDRGEFAAYGAAQRSHNVTLPADRGAIFDRNGNDLAVSIPQRTIWADPSQVQDPAATAQSLARLLSLDPTATKDLQAKLTGDKRFTYVARRVDDKVADAVADAHLEGVALLEEPRRFSPAGDLARSVLGQVGVDNEGLSGLEGKYDSILKGTPGELHVEQAPGGRTIPAGERRVEPAKRGDDLVLTLDRSLQYETERALGAQILAKGAKGGTAIVSRPDTGEVLAMANLSTDPETGQLTAPGGNNAVTAVFEPGSVNKVITVAAAIEEGLVTPDTQIVVPDRYQVGDHEFSDHDPHPTESYSVTRILTESSNVGTIKIAQMLGKDRLDEYLRKFGFGEKTALELPYEASGILLERSKYNATSIGAIPIGQGIAVTGMQMLAAYNVLANDGMYIPPKLVQETVDPSGTKHRTDAGEPRRVVSAETARQLRDMMVNVVAEGTGSRGGITGYNVAGKTGTARKPINGGYEDAAGKYHYVATFAGFVPAERPALSIIVVIDEPTGDIYGGSVAAPVFADLAQYGLRLFHIPPPLVEKEPGTDTAAGQAAGETPPATTANGKVRAEAATASTSTTLPTTSGTGAQAGLAPPTGTRR